ncbi:MAG: YHS domain-containing protein, partial [Mesorhizobium sp.]
MTDRHDDATHADVAHGSCCSSHGSVAAEAAVVRDPVCGMTVDPAAGKPSAAFGGHTYHFCSEGCRTKFMKEPEAFLKATDPVCGMTVERAKAKHFARHEGKGFYFCSAGCKGKFEADPGKYLSGQPAPEPMPKGTQYTCPMHPEIIRDKPGSCPICGMALEPMGVPTGDQGPNPE